MRIRLPFHYGWLIVFISFFIFTTYGLFFSYGVFFKPIMEVFGWSRAQTSFAFTLFMTTYAITAIPAGWLFDRYGPRIPLYLSAILIGVGFFLCSYTKHLWHLWVFFGFIAAAGHGAVYVVPVSTIMRWFAKRRGMAIGIGVAGLGAGISVVPLIAERLIFFYSWRTAFVILGLAYAIIHLTGATFLRKSPEDMGLKAYRKDRLNANAWSGDEGSMLPEDIGLTVWEAFKACSFWMLYLSIILIFASETFVMVHAVPFALDMGINTTIAAGAMTAMGVGSMVGRIVMGALSDRVGRKGILTAAYLLQGIMMFCLLWVRTSAGLYIVMAIMGLSFGGWASVFPLLAGEYFGFKHMGKILAIIINSAAFSGILGPFFAGYIFDVSGSYRWAFILGAFICLSAVLMSFFISPQLKVQEPVEAYYK
jgi:MFS family permease